MQSIGTDIQKAKAIIEQNGLVAVPTETVYGLAANGLEESAVAKIFAAKKRPTFDPLILHIPSAHNLKRYVQHVPDVVQTLIDRFWPGPLTVLLEKKDNIPDLVTSGLPTVAFRVPNHAVTLELLRSLDFPLAAPSANPFGYISPTTAQHVADQLASEVDYILDGGACTVGVESTIVGVEGNQVVVYRLGGLSIESIESIIGQVVIRSHSSSNPKAPGMLESHYAPGKPVYIGSISELIPQFKGKRIGILSFQETYTGCDAIEVLSPSGNMIEAATHLFAAMRRLDASAIDLILTEKFPNYTLGKAINDRLQRAAVTLH